MVWDSPLTALAASSGFREQERVPGALVLCPGHSKQNSVAGARLGSAGGGGGGWAAPGRDVVAPTGELQALQSLMREKGEPLPPTFPSPS